MQPSNPILQPLLLTHSLNMAGLLADLGPVGQSILLALLIVCPVLIAKARNSTKYTIVRGAPIVGRKWKYEPGWLTRYRFLTGAWEITKEGWEKVRPHVSFILSFRACC